MATKTATKTLVEQFTKIRNTNTPMVQIRTSDATGVMARITAAVADAPVIQWDANAGFNARNKQGNAALVTMLTDPESGDTASPMIVNAADAAFVMRRAVNNSILFVLNAQRVWNDTSTAQGFWNTRDLFKSTFRTLVMLTTMEAKAPRELETDLIVIEDPLPDVDQLVAMVTKACQNSHPPLPVPDKATMAKATDALKGFSLFVSEQMTAMALTKKGVNIAELWTRKKQNVQETPGATVYEGAERFADIGGHEGLKRNLLREINSKNPIKVIVVFDEFEKALAGASSDHVGDGGVAKDKAQVILTKMQDHKMRGVLLMGHPGAGKTVVAKALGNEADCLVIQADLGAMSGGVVGESEARIRAFFNMLIAIAGDNGVFVVATLNGTGAITTEIRRRFRTGFYFVDLPNAQEKASIWSIQMKRYGVPNQPLPNDDQWTGAEIENCCEKADSYGCSLIEAATMIVPVAKMQPKLIEARRREAHSAMLSAATGETYVMPGAREVLEPDYSEPAGRRVNVMES